MIRKQEFGINQAVRARRLSNPETLVLERVDAPTSANLTAIVRVAVATVRAGDWNTVDVAFTPVGANSLLIGMARDLDSEIMTLCGGVTR